ncbi:uncharacterized protein LOC124686200 isoform X2 [Lolium rigidum]|uniref:uncharacterized protein LOC124686200 isoform X2 n=1 Tax=Lolium rigidum TaxID=89674 RepID=UPI001F5C311E|nr:uncharacterized protein LOC124686200 isoform X2 [Lolium rigidum]
MPCEEQKYHETVVLTPSVKMAASRDNNSELRLLKSQLKMECVYATVSKVLDDDNLLIEILLRVAFPSTLVCTALVCKRWFHHISDRKFLCRFRKLHPPCLLGYYLYGRFVPMLPQPPELAAVTRRVASYSLGGTEDATVLIRDCRNGSVYSLLCKRGSGVTGGVHRPLCQDRAVAVIPPLSHPNFIASRILSKEEDSGGLSYMYVTLGPPFERTRFTVFMLQDGVWCMHMSVTAQVCCRFKRLQAVLVENKIYLTATMSDIIVLDLTTSSMSTIQLPQGVKSITSATMLSPADDASGVYLIKVDLELRIWLHSGENWSLVDTICYREMVANLRMSDCTVDHENTTDVHISQVGDNAEFAFLQMGRCTFYLDIKCRTLRKVHERKHWDPFEQIYPFMMIWPPTFPTLKDDFARDAV